MELRLRVRGRDLVVTVDSSTDPTRITIDGNAITVEAFTIGDRYLTVRIGGEQQRLPFARCGAQLHLGHGGSNYTFTRVDDEDDGSDVSSAGFVAELTSPMPGKVIEVLVASGDCVEADQALLVLEAMKMEQTVRTPAAARIGEVGVAAGTMIAPGQTLIRLEALD